MTIERVFPSALTFEDGLQVSVAQPDALISKAAFGPTVGMRYADRTLRRFRGRFTDIPKDDVRLLRLESFLEQVPPMLGTFWLTEALSGTHRNLRLPQRGDGTRKTFVVPIRAGGTISEVFVDDVPQEAADWSAISTANLIASDHEANGDSESSTVPSGVTSPSGDAVTISRARPAIGYTSFVVTPAAAKTGVELGFSKLAVTAGLAYRGQVIVLAEVGSYDVNLEWYDGTPTLLSTTTATTTITAAGYMLMSASGTAPTGAVTVRLTIKRVHSSGAAMYVGGGQVTRGANQDAFFLPDDAPMLLDFNGAPSDRAEIAISGTGRRMTKVRMTGKDFSWRLYDLGHVLPGGFQAVEVRP